MSQPTSARPSRDKVICIGFDGKKYTALRSDLVEGTSIYGIVIEDGKLLLLNQKNGYDLPGGHCEHHETDQQCVEREVKEETGLDVRIKRKAGDDVERYFKHTQSDGRCEHSLMRYYVCELVGGKISSAGFDEFEKEYAISPEWLPIDRLDSIIVGSSYDWRELIYMVADDRN